MTKQQFINKWWPACSTTFIDDIDTVIATEIEKAKVQPQPSDKVQISKHTLVEVNRAFRALKQDRNSYIHKVFSDDGVFDAMEEIHQVHEAYYGQKKEEQPKLDPIEAWKQYKEENKPQPEPTKQPSSQTKLDNSFDRDRFERIFCAIVASGKTETWEQDFKGTIKTIEKLDAYYATKEKGGANG